jgi:acetyl esterase/lipase
MPLERVVLTPADDPRLAEVTAALRATPAAGTHEDKRPIVETPHVGDPDRLRAEGWTVELVDAGGVPGWLATPAGGAPDGTLVGLHGGGFVVCSGRTHLRRFAAVGAVAGWRVLSVDYRLAPEHPFPAPVDDAEAALRWAHTTFGEPIALIGDSAGATLCLAVLQRVRDDGPVATAVVISPWADLRSNAPSYVERRERDPFAHLDDLDAYASMYVGDEDISDPMVSPAHADFRDFPPLLVQIGSEESMYDDAVTIADRAARAGVTVRLEEWAGMFHTWHGYVGGLTGADAAIASAAAWLDRSGAG